MSKEQAGQQWLERETETERERERGRERETWRQSDRERTS